MGDEGKIIKKKKKKYEKTNQINETTNCFCQTIRDGGFSKERESWEICLELLLLFPFPSEPQQLEAFRDGITPYPARMDT